MNESFLIRYLEDYNKIKFDYIQNEQDKARALMNVTMPNDLSEEFYAKQDEYLQDLLSRKTIINASDILKNDRIALYLGDITTIKADAVVNAGNSELLGCFAPLHYCIDNAIHSFGGLQIRRDLTEIMQGGREENGRCKVTKGYNLPCKFVFHTVGPIFNGTVTRQMEEDLTNCYLSCLKRADEMQLDNVVFCSISTGVFGFPVETACRIAINTVRNYLAQTNGKLKVVFDLFLREDYATYEREFRK